MSGTCQDVFHSWAAYIRRPTRPRLPASTKSGATYKEFEQVAREEGFEEIANLFQEIAEVEEEHEKRFRALLKNLETGKVFKKDTAVRWRCRNCGYVHEGLEAPKVCPACAHPQSYYEVACDNY